jgi:hypothetical protein
MSGGVVLAIVGVWVVTQVTVGDALTRLKVVTK